MLPRSHFRFSVYLITLNLKGNELFAKRLFSPFDIECKHNKSSLLGRSDIHLTLVIIVTMGVNVK
jgi:hypothetical protein